MLTTRPFEIIVAIDADGGLRLSPHGDLDLEACVQLNEAVIGGLRSAVARLEIDLRDAVPVEQHCSRVVRAGALLARHLEIEFRVIGDRFRSSTQAE